MKRYFGAALVLTACAGYFKPPAPDRHLHIAVATESFDGPHGYHLAALPEPTATVVHLDVRYPVGSADDPPGKAGLAHVTAHLLQDVVTPSGRIAEIYGRSALAWYAETSAEHTTFDIVAEPAALPTLLQLEADRLRVGCDGLSPDDFDRARMLAEDERQRRLGETGETFERALLEAVYPVGHPYRQVETASSLARLTFDDACVFLKSAYRRGAVSIVASGMVDRDALQAAAGPLAMAPARALTRRAPLPALARPSSVTVHVASRAPLILATWPLPPRGSRDYRLLALATADLAETVGSYAHDYHWGHDAFRTELGGDGAPVLVLGVELESLADRDEARAAFDKAIDRMHHDLLSDGRGRDSREWMMRWQDAMEAQLARWELLADRNAIVADALGAGESSDVLVRRIDELAAASPDEANDLALAWLDPDRRQFIEVAQNDPTLGNIGFATTPGADRVATSALRARADAPVTLGTPRAIPPAETFVMANGMRVVLWPHGSSGLVHGQLLVGDHALTSREPATEVDLTIARLTWNLRDSRRRKGVEPTDAMLILAGEFDPALVKRHLGYQTARFDRGAPAMMPAVSIDGGARWMVFEQLSSPAARAQRSSEGRFVVARQAVLDALLLPQGASTVAMSEQLAMLARVGLAGESNTAIAARVAAITYAELLTSAARTLPDALPFSDGHLPLIPAVDVLGPNRRQVLRQSYDTVAWYRFQIPRSPLLPIPVLGDLR